MIHVVEPSAYENYENYLDEMYRQRTRLFSEKLEWEVSVDDKGREIDEFDHMSPVYLLAICPTTKRLKGSLRLLPTTGPTLLSQAFGATVPDGADVCSPLIWECTRLCVEEYSVENRSRLAGGLRTSFELLIALGEVGIRSGWTGFVGNFEPTMLKIYERAGCKVDVLSELNIYGTDVALGLFPVSQDILSSMKRRCGISGSILSSNMPDQVADPVQAAVA